MAIKSDSYLTSLFGLEGKSIVVTGAGGGIGLAISEGLLRAGAEVALCNRTTAKCKPLADRIIAEGGTASVHQLDVTSLDSIHACVDEVMAKYGKIDVLFNVAGINKRGGLLDVEEADYDRIMDTNLKGLFFMSQAVAREMYKRRTGSIINIGSHNDEGMLGGCSVYGATKSYVLSFTESLAEELKGSGVTVTAFCPGPTRTQFGVTAGLSQESPFDRLSADPERVAETGFKGMMAGRAANRFGAFMTRFLPRCLVRRIAGGMLAKLK